VIVGIGDDAAVLAAADGRVVATTDMLIEGRHFRREWSPAADIGRKAAARNLADIAAMGAKPTALLVSFAGPGDLEVEWVLELADGIASEAAAAGAAVAGGDTSSADVVILAVTALGDLAGREPVTRRGARPGDVVALAGTVGAAAAGLALLNAGLTGPGETRPGQTRPGEGVAALIAAHRRPEPPYDAGPEAAALGATSMIDISDGLIADLGHIADSSDVLIELTSSLVTAEPVARPGSLAVAAALVGDGDWTQWVLAGGDDHALAATFPASVTLPEMWTVIGRVTTGHGVLVDGQRWDKPPGWEHFRVRLRIVAKAIVNVTRRSGHLLDITTVDVASSGGAPSSKQGEASGNLAWTRPVACRGQDEARRHKSRSGFASAPCLGCPARAAGEVTRGVQPSLAATRAALGQACRVSLGVPPHRQGCHADALVRR
jgi:thiamine-monophosphate kinase